MVGIGVAPVTDWLAGSGLELRDGVVADADPRRRAARRVRRRRRRPLAPRAASARRCALEHWTNAAEQGAAAARNLLATAAGGDGTPYQAVPFFWSDQYDARIQCLGRPDPRDEVGWCTARWPSAGSSPCTAATGGCEGCSGVSLPKRVMPYRALLARSVSWDDALAHARAGEG